jgi:hypothetical protein
MRLMTCDKRKTRDDASALEKLAVISGQQQELKRIRTVGSSYDDLATVSVAHYYDDKYDSESDSEEDLDCSIQTSKDIVLENGSSIIHVDYRDVAISKTRSSYSLKTNSNNEQGMFVLSILWR